MPMPLHAAMELAKRKGFTLTRTQFQLYRLTDNATLLPELNLSNGTTFFTLAEVTDLLTPLHDRPLPVNGNP
jgi:hypothetical protein